MTIRSLPRVALALAMALAGACNFSQEPSREAAGVPLGHVRVTKTGTKMGAVTFFHRQHKKYALDLQKCETCHHVGKWEQACGSAGCHSDPVADAGGRRLHEGCVDKCHRQSGGKAPTSCAACHAGTT